MSLLISSVTFKLSLEAAAAAGHVRRALGCWGRISSAGSRGKERPRAGRLGTCEGGAESAQAWGAAQLELQGCGGKRSTWELQGFESGKRNLRSCPLPSQVPEFVVIVVNRVFIWRI